MVKFSVYLNRHVFVMKRQSIQGKYVTQQIPRNIYLKSWFLCFSNIACRKCSCCRKVITKTRLCKYIENFTCKNIKFSEKKSDIFHISAQNIDCGYSLEPPRRGGSNEYPQSMLLSRNKKNKVYPCKPQFYYIKVGFQGVKII